MTDTTSLVSAGAGAIAGGGLTAWFVKAMIHRVLAQYDKGLADLQSLKEKNAVLEVKAAEVIPLREEVYKLRERLALSEAKVSKAWEKIDGLCKNVTFLVRHYKENFGDK